MSEFPKELEAKRTRCVVYTRVMGYMRPVESFNIGKTGEHKERVMFEETRCKHDRKQIACDHESKDERSAE